MWLEQLRQNMICMRATLHPVLGMKNEKKNIHIIIPLCLIILCIALCNVCSNKRYSLAENRPLWSKGEVEVQLSSFCNQDIIGVRVVKVTPRPLYT